MQAAPDDLERFARVAGQLSVDLHRTAADLGPALDRLRAAGGAATAVGDVAPLDADLRADADRLVDLAQLTGTLARQLRELDDAPLVGPSAFVTDGRLDLRALAGTLRAVHRHRGTPAPPDHHPRRWAATPAGRRAVAEARELLRDGPRGVPPHRVAALQTSLARLSPELADAVVASLSDAELDRLVVAVTRGRWPGEGWDVVERHRLWATIGSRVSLPTFRRLVARTDDLDPDPRDAEPAADELARLVAIGLIPHERWFEELTYAQRPGVLFWHGADDDHTLAPSDVTQGMLGNCYLVAAIIAAADRHPERLRELFTEHANGTVSVTFADGSEVIVTPDLPVHPDDPTVASFVGHRNAEHRDPPAGRHELWPKLLEKAYVQRFGDWGTAASGVPGEALRTLVGGRRHERRLVDRDGRRTPDGRTRNRASVVRRDLAAGRSVLVGTVTADRLPDQRDVPAERRLTPKHAYVVHAIDQDGTATVRDPNRPADQLQRLAWDDLLDAAIYLDIHTLDDPRPATTDR